LDVAPAALEEGSENPLAGVSQFKNGVKDVRVRAGRRHSGGRRPARLARWREGPEGGPSAATPSVASDPPDRPWLVL